MFYFYWTCKKLICHHKIFMEIISPSKSSLLYVMYDYETKGMKLCDKNWIYFLLILYTSQWISMLKLLRGIVYDVAFAPFPLQCFFESPNNSKRSEVYPKFPQPTMIIAHFSVGEEIIAEFPNSYGSLGPRNFQNV